MNYSASKEISVFFNKAKNYIGQTGGVLANEVEEKELEFNTIALSNLLESLNSPYLDWSEEEILQIIHYWNNRADLNNLPYMQITDYYVNITGGTSTDLGDVESLVKDILSRTPHNSLANIQGGTLTERYHLTKAQRDWIDCQRGITPCPQLIDFSVSLGLTSTGTKWPSGYYELGTTVSANTLQGNLNYGSDKQAISYGYKKNGVQLGTLVSNPAANSQPNPYTDPSTIKVDTTYSFEATLLTGTKSATQSVQFRQPMYYGIINIENYVNSDKLHMGTKLVRDRGEMTLDFDIPAGNTTKSEGSYDIAYVFIPASWGKFTTAFNGIFDFASDWKDFGRDMILADGTTVPGRLIVYPTQIEGLTTFKFNW